jgi:hypothetical protein
MRTELLPLALERRQGMSTGKCNDLLIFVGGDFNRLSCKMLFVCIGCIDEDNLDTYQGIT